MQGDTSVGSVAGQHEQSSQTLRGITLFLINWGTCRQKPGFKHVGNDKQLNPRKY